MRKSKKPDYLTLCSIAAQKVGTSYGKYMVMHGYHPPIQADTEDEEAPTGHFEDLCLLRKGILRRREKAENLLQL